MQSEQIKEAAQFLLAATNEAKEVDRISSRYPQLTLGDAYKIQHEGMKIRESQGAKWVGWKMGLTSEAKRKQMNLDSAIFGYLHDKGAVHSKTLNLKGLIHPKIEPEIGFRIRSELKGKVSFEQALNAIGGICAAMEIIDSRFIGFKYFSLPDVVADNCSAAQYIWGEELSDFKNLQMDQLKMSLLVNGIVVQEAFASEISGHPVHSLMQLSELLAIEGLSVPAGCIVLAGAATPAVALEPGQTIELRVDSLPTLKVEAT